jgi:hypothetical protein
MVKKTKGPVEVVPKLVAILAPLSVGDRAKAVRATFTLLGDGGSDVADAMFGGDDGGGGRGGMGGGVGNVGHVGNEQMYFASKKPRTNIEELAVAARYRELRHKAENSSKAELREVFKNARHNFVANYRRDLENARVAGLFTRGTGRDAATLTNHGQQYVDALPDRDAVKTLSGQPKGKKSKKRKKKA